MIESAPKNFMPIQTPDLHSVLDDFFTVNVKVWRSVPRGILNLEI